jgi:hypothetical protein
MDCIDIKERFGKRHKVTPEDGNAWNRDPWLWVIPCGHGHIYVHGGQRLGAATNGRRVGGILAKIPYVQIEQEGSDGFNVSFDVADFAKVAKVMRPRRRRRLSPEQRERLVAAGAEALKRRRNNVHVDFPTQGATDAA